MHTSMMMTVNSPPVPHRDISGSSPSTYRPYNEEYSSVQRIERPVEVEVERSKKEKKWSIGKLFRRKKKDDGSGSSSQSDDGINGLSSSKNKSKKKKRPPVVNNFDHIVIRDTRRAQSLAKPITHVKDDGILSDPSADIIYYKSKIYNPYETKDYFEFKNDRVATTVLDVPLKKKRKSRLKARVEALRNSIRGESSSDEESLKSSNSSSIIRFRSEDSLMRSRDSSLNKKSRSARNERYIKRLSRDEENQLNKEAELLQQGYTKAEVEMLTRTPTSQSSGYGTCKRDPNNSIKPEHFVIGDSKKGPLKSESISSFPSTQSYLSSINFNAKVNNDHINYSIQCANNNPKNEALYANNQREGSLSNSYGAPENIMCVKFPLGNVLSQNNEDRSPPIPPPRDMQRKVVTPISMYYENSPIIKDRMINSNSAIHGVPNNDFERIMRRSQERTQVISGLRRPISNSEDHIAMQSNEYMQHYIQRNEQPRRPASVSAEPNHYGIYLNSPPWKKRTEQTNTKLEPASKQDYLYYADQSPRSRRPISIKTSQNNIYQNQYLSDSQTSFNVSDSVYRRPRNASDFWKKIDDAEKIRKQQELLANTRNKLDNSQNSNIFRTFSERTKPTNKLIQNRAESLDTCNKQKLFDVMDGAQIWKATTEYKQCETTEPMKSDISPVKTHVRHKSDTFVAPNNHITSDDEKHLERRKSTNLDDALNELEAIYNSLGLGDEDLLDRAERRELMTPKFNDHFNDWNGNDNDVQLRSQPSTPLRRISRRSTLPDKLQDDMAFRRMNSLTNKEKPNHNEVQSQISYMLASPVYVPYASDDDRNSERNEPDIIHDDVVYRNIKQTNNRLKTIDPQPPFGIPVGPVSPAPQSDYLHATPENKGRSRFVPKRSPDIVTDDLAYRSLRKDNKNSSLFNGDEYNGLINNNSYTEFPFTKESVSNMKKKRAVRSLSANIFTMIQKDIDDAINMSKVSTLQKTNSNIDVMRRLRETFESNENSLRDYHPRNKVKQRHNTVNLHIHNTQTPSHNFTRDDSFIHPDDTCSRKPSSCDMSKNSSPLNKSPQIVKRSSKDEFQHVLSMLAQEAMDTSNKLGVALAELDKNRNKNETPIQNKISSSRQEFLNGLTEKSYNNNKSDSNEISNSIKATDVQDYLHNSENRNPDLIETSFRKSTESKDSFNDSEQQNRAKRTEDSLLVISDQIDKVGQQLKSNQVFNLEQQSQSNCPNSQNNKEAVHSSKNPEEKSWENTLKDTKDNQSIESEVTSDILHYAPFGNLNTASDTLPCKKEIISEAQMSKRNSSNPFLNSDGRIEELNEMQAFKELKDGIKDLIAGISEVNDKLFVNKISVKRDSDENDKTQNMNNERQPLHNIIQCGTSEYKNDFESKKDEADSTEYNSSEELATIFKLDVPVPADENNDKNTHENREILNSPKLVKTMSQQLRRLSVDEGTSSQSTPLSNNVVPWRTKKHNTNSQSKSKGNNQKSKRNWHDSGTLMLACSYTLMFSQHLADLDWLTLLGLLLAIVTIIAMLML